MKLLKMFLPILFTCVVFCSCGINNMYEENKSECASSVKSEAKTETETEIETNMETIEHPTLPITSLKEYKALIISDIVSSQFVSYESISMFGEFGFLVFTCDTAGNIDYSKYVYNFNYPTFDIALQIYENGEKSDAHDLSIEQITDVNTNDLRTLSSNLNGIYKYEANGFEYIYLNGKLSSIRWTNDGILYILSSNDMALSKYEFKDNDVISKLLCSERDGLAELAIFKDAVTEK